jgi:peptidoglycan-associated lipoprotein
MKTALVWMATGLMFAGCTVDPGLRDKELADDAAKWARTRQAPLPHNQHGIAVGEAAQRALTKATSQDEIAGKSLDDALAALSSPNIRNAGRSIYYDYDAYDIRPAYQALVEAHAQVLLKHQNFNVRIEGNCDERGSEAYNLALGQRRADSVKRALKLLGVPVRQVTAVSLGSTHPKTRGDQEQDFAENRRSDLVYVGLDKEK